MRIVTYADPFRIDENKERWKTLTNHPHFCASDTLVQGLIRNYGRTQFKLLRTVDDFLTAFLGEFTNNPMNDMQLFVSVCDFIRSWPDSPSKDSFLFNKSEVVNAIKLLIPLQCNSSGFEKKALSESQRKLLEIYEHIKQSSTYKAFQVLEAKTFEDYKHAVQAAQAQEIFYLCSQDEEIQYLDKHGIRKEQIAHSPELAAQAGGLLLEYYEEEAGIIAQFTNADKIAQIRHAVEQCKPKEDDFYKQIIIHGVHKMTPYLVYAIQKLERIDVDVILVFNYVKGLPEFYGTWERDYEWCDAVFEYAEELPKNSGRDEGWAMVNALAGISNDKLTLRPLIKYDNKTAFALSNVGKVYEDAEKKLANMKVQYYVVNGRHCNELLQMYYPEQYKNKAFLSYPVGQLILGLYKMWDFEKRGIAFDYNCLSECAVSGLFQNSELLLELLRKTKLYFSDLSTYVDYKERFALLRKANQLRNTDAQFESFGRIAFFSMTPQEIDVLEQFIDQINNYAMMIFADLSEKMEYVNHFRRLIDIISASAADQTRQLSDTEEELIREINQKLSAGSGYVTGNPQDVQDALAFFLASRKDNENSNWIVRDFEQIDGAVLLSRTTNAQIYNLGLLSNEHMMRRSTDELPWPLNDEFFACYGEELISIRAINAANRERKNFYKFALFYGAFFTDRRVALEFSYLGEENGNKQKPFYLLTAMGLREDPGTGQLPGLIGTARDDRDRIFIDLKEDFASNEMFGVCPYKYFLNRVVHADILYYSEFHIKYYISYVLVCMARYKVQSGTEKEKAVKEAVEDLRVYFPFWGDVVFTDTEDLARDTVKDYGLKNASYAVDLRKKNYLFARCDDDNGNLYYPTKTDYRPQIEKYLKEPQIYPVRTALPPKVLCDRCNFEDICLRRYYDVHAEETV